MPKAVFKSSDRLPGFFSFSLVSNSLPYNHNESRKIKSVPRQLLLGLGEAQSKSQFPPQLTHNYTVNFAFFLALTSNIENNRKSKNTLHIKYIYMQEITL